MKLAKINVSKSTFIGGLFKFWFFAASFCFCHCPLNGETVCRSIDHDPVKPYISLSLSSAPHLEFFSNPSLKGTPVLLLNEKGLNAGKQRLCSWPGETFTSVNEVNRVLGFDGNKVLPCESGPIRSEFGDLGKGTAVLCIEATKIGDDLVETTYRGKACYFQLSALPKGLWQLDPVPKPNEDMKRDIQALLKSDPSLRKFIERASSCLATDDSRNCFEHFVATQVYLPEANKGWYVTSHQYVDFVWNDPALLSQLKLCFEAKEYPAISGDDRFITLSSRYETGYCDIEKTSADWVIRAVPHLNEIP